MNKVTLVEEFVEIECSKLVPILLAWSFTYYLIDKILTSFWWITMFKRREKLYLKTPTGYSEVSIKRPVLLNDLVGIFSKSFY